MRPSRDKHARFPLVLANILISLLFVAVTFFFAGRRLASGGSQPSPSNLVVSGGPSSSSDLMLRGVVGRQCTSDYPQRASRSGEPPRTLELGPGCAGVALRELSQPTVAAAPQSGVIILILFVISHDAYTSMMDRYFFEQLEACDRHPQMNCTLWGPGFDGYQESATLEDNIAMRHGAAEHYQVHFFQPGYPPVSFSSVDPPRGVVRAQRFNEDWGSFNAHRWQSLRVGIVMFSFAQDMFEGAARFAVAEATVIGGGGAARGPYDGNVFVHAPMGADPNVYFADYENYHGNKVDGLLVGAAAPSCYPMRARIKQMIDTGVLPGVVRHHPGYTLSSLEQHGKQRAEYAAALRSARLSYVTAMHYRHRLQKFSEGALSGTLMLGTLPQEREELFRDIMVELREDDSDEYITAVAHWWLEHESERRAVARLAEEIGRRLFTWDSTFADRLFNAYQRLQRGETGWWFAEPFTVRTPRRNICDCNQRKSEEEYKLAPRCAHVSLAGAR